MTTPYIQPLAVSPHQPSEFVLEQILGIAKAWRQPVLDSVIPAVQAGSL